MTLLKAFTPPADNQIPGAGRPYADVNALVDALAAMGSGLSVLNTVAALGGADPSGQRESSAQITAVAAGGGNVSVPAGTYLVNVATAVTLAAAGTVLVGAGKGVTTLVIGGTGGAAAVAITASFCGVRNMTILGGASTTVTSNPQCDAISITGAQFCTVEDVFWQYVNGRCGYSVGSASLANIGCRFIRPTGYNCAAGVHIKGVTGSSFGGQQWIVDPHFSQIGAASGGAANLDGILIEDASDVWVTGYDGAISQVSTGSTLHIKGTCSSIQVTAADVGCFPNSAPVGTVLLIDDSSNGSPTDCRFTGGVFQQNLTGITVAGAASRISFNGCTFKNNTTHGVVLSGSGSQINFTDCTWNGNGAGGSGTNYEINATGTSTGRMFNCHWLTAITTIGTPGVQFVANLASSGQAIEFIDSEFRGTGIAPSTCFNGNLPSLVRKCRNYNPHGAVTVTVPASASPTAALHYDSVFHITTGASTCTIVRNTNGNGGGTGPTITLPASSGPYTIELDGQQTLTPTFTSAPTWVVDGK